MLYPFYPVGYVLIGLWGHALHQGRIRPAKQWQDDVNRRVLLAMPSVTRYDVYFLFCAWCCHSGSEKLRTYQLLNTGSFFMFRTMPLHEKLSIY